MIFEGGVIFLWLLLFVLFWVGGYVFWKDSKSATNRAFLYMSLANAAWVTIVFLEDGPYSDWAKFFLLRADYATGLIFSFFIMLFCFRISDLSALQKSKTVFLVGALTWILAGLAMASPLVVETFTIDTIGNIIPTFGVLESVFMGAVLLVLLTGIGSLGFGYRVMDDRGRARFAYLLVGIVFAVVTSIVCNIILLDRFKAVPDILLLITRIGIFSSLFIPLFSGYSIIKHRLMNVQVLATETIAFFFLFANFTIIFFSQSAVELLVRIIAFGIILFLIIALIRYMDSEMQRKLELQVIADRLALANQELKRLDNAKSEFISIASHQLRTPLTVIKGYTSLILEGNYGKIDSQLQDVVNKVYAANTRLIDLVENLLSISRLESGRMQYTFQPTQVEDIVTDLGNMFVVSAKKRGLDFSIVLPEQPLPKVDLDPAKMREVMSNLIDNAIKYTESGSVTVSLWQEGDKLRYSVKDTGIGVTAEDKERLFSKFSRSKETERLYVGGTGLGLYVGKTFVEKHGGRIWVESAGRGRGSEFIFELPISRDSL